MSCRPGTASSLDPSVSHRSRDRLIYFNLFLLFCFLAAPAFAIPVGGARFAAVGYPIFIIGTGTVYASAYRTKLLFFLFHFTFFFSSRVRRSNSNVASPFLCRYCATRRLREPKRLDRILGQVTQKSLLFDSRYFLPLGIYLYLIVFASHPY